MGQVAEVELDLDRAGLDELRSRAEEVAPEGEAEFLRYLVYLGAGYLEAEALAAAAGSAVEAHARVDRLLGAVAGYTSTLSFRFADSAREFAEEQRAHAAHDRSAGAYGVLRDKLEVEIATREKRIANLEAAMP